MENVLTQHISKTDICGGWRIAGHRIRVTDRRLVRDSRHEPRPNVMLHTLLTFMWLGHYFDHRETRRASQARPIAEWVKANIPQGSTTIEGDERCLSRLVLHGPALSRSREPALTLGVDVDSRRKPTVAAPRHGATGFATAQGQ